MIIILSIIIIIIIIIKNNNNSNKKRFKLFLDVKIAVESFRPLLLSCSLRRLWCADGWDLCFDMMYLAIVLLQTRPQSGSKPFTVIFTFRKSLNLFAIICIAIIIVIRRRTSANTQSQLFMVRTNAFYKQVVCLEMLLF